MAIQRWSPWRDLMRMQEDLNRSFEFFLRPGTVSEFRWMPDIDVFEKEDKVIVRADLPEIEAEDVDVSIIENVLRIRGERKHGEEVKDESYFMTERRFGSFGRAIELPVPVRSEDIQATYKEGVLEIALPKAEVKKAKEIRIKVA